MMIKRILFCATLLSLAAACSSETKSKLGLSKSAPDEFTVVSHPPLIVPPILTLPQPGPKGESGKSNKIETKNNASHSAQEDAEIRKQLGVH